MYSTSLEKSGQLIKPELNNYLDADSQNQSGLNKPVLLLNRNYTALTTVRARRALTLTIRDSAEILSIEGGDYTTYDFDSWKYLSQMQWETDISDYIWIHCVSFKLMTPTIIRLTEYGKTPYRKIRLTKRNLYARDGHKCQYCGKNFPSSKLSLDHVVPKSQGGKTTWENSVCACIPCNARKDNKTPKQARMKLVKVPVEPNILPIFSSHMKNNPEWAPFIN
jgi:5-methylcytosine-specific restriction endonuclease McrA